MLILLENAIRLIIYDIYFILFSLVYNLINIQYRNFLLLDSFIIQIFLLRCIKKFINLIVIVLIDLVVSNSNKNITQQLFFYEKKCLQINTNTMIYDLIEIKDIKQNDNNAIKKERNVNNNKSIY